MDESSRQYSYIVGPVIIVPKMEFSMSPKRQPTTEDTDILETILNNSSNHENFNAFLSRLRRGNEEEVNKNNFVILLLGHYQN